MPDWGLRLMDIAGMLLIGVVWAFLYAFHSEQDTSWRHMHWAARVGFVLAMSIVACIALGLITAVVVYVGWGFGT